MPAERVAFELADAMTDTPPNVTDELFARLQQHYNEAELVELAAIVAQENFRSRFNTTFRVESAECTVPLPKRNRTRHPVVSERGPSVARY